MPKNSITDYDNIAANNTDVQSVDIAEGCAPSGINNAIREIMADLADVNDGTVTLTSPSVASMTVTGDLTVDTNTLYVDSTNNNVGIGTAPDSDAQLHISSNDTIIRLEDADDTGSYADLRYLNGRLVIQSDDNSTSGFSPTVEFQVSGSEAMRIDSSGNVGIGTASPDRLLTLQGDNSYMWMKDAAGGNSAFIGTDGTNDAYIRLYDSTHTAKVEIETDGDTYFNGGNVGIGTNNPTPDYGVNFTTLNINGTKGGVLGFSRGTNSATGQWAVYTSDDDSLRFDNGSERMRIDSSGNLLVGKTTDANTSVGITIRPDGGSRYSTSGTGSFIQMAFFRNGSAGESGSISTTSTSTSYNTSSDYRLKTDAQPMTGAVERVKALNPVNFEWISNGERVDGFLAHEAQEVVPEAVTGTKDAMRDEEYEVTPAVLDDDGNVVTEAVMGTRSVPDYQGIDQSKLVPLLTAALQEAIAKIETLEAKVTALEA